MASNALTSTTMVNAIQGCAKASASPPTTATSSVTEAVQLLTGSGEVLSSARDPALSAWLAKATPAPVAPTQHLVVTGLYRFVRNPMYVGVLLLIFGQMLLFSSAALLAYGVAMWTAFHLFVVFFEEQRLERKFPEEYPAYAAAVPRWIPRLTPWKPEAGETSKKADADSAGL